MSASSHTHFHLKVTPLPSDFEGDLPEILEAFAERLVIIADKRYTSYVIGSTEPANDQGPWLRVHQDGRTSWYSFSLDEGRYVPVEAYVEPPYTVSTNVPVDAPNPGGDGIPPEPRLWIRTDGGGSHKDTYWWSGTIWKRFTVTIPSGATRPVDPSVGQKFFDTSINCELIYERGAWRTASGSPGDIKHVRAGSIAEALEGNPGWKEFTLGRSRAIIGATPPGGLAGGDLTPRTIEERVGAETHRLSKEEMPSHDHAIEGMHIGDGSSSGSVWNHRFRDDEDNPKKTNTEGGNEPHENMSPSIALWCLEKE